ncbi:omptin family outer membrane protease [Yersinia massiliensis]|uniref:omptin family outer membrane protease n=1 Tax=Yersinia massiliensis TaxID=419257 RepID=UPI0002DEFEA3|nr:omptin family outer membrane protease [Yersinia massiliensis]MCB5308009.1 omptin family outer membrane protease [Yersinia massiliensis]
MKNVTLIKKSVCALALLITCHTASASYDSSITDNLKMSTSLGLLNAESQESVYQPENQGHKVSQLDWKVRNAPIIKMDISWDLLSRFTLTAKGWSTLSSSDGIMDNYDWLNQNQINWSEWSHHSKTNLNYANEIDLNVKFWLLNNSNYRIGAISGYQQSNNSWTAHGGDLIYSNGSQLINLSDDIKAISYKQKFDMPYIGLAGYYRHQNFELNTLFKYSNWVKANSLDKHHLRNQSFNDTSKNARYYGVAMDIGYYVTKNTKVFVEASWNRYSEGKGNSQTLNHANGDVINTQEGAGIAYRNQTLSLGLQHKF